MKNYYLIALVLIYWNSFSQKKEFDIQKEYSIKQVIADIDYTEKYLCKFHPEPYKYISKDSLHSFVNWLKSRVDTPLTEMQTRYYIKRIINKIGCGHTEVGASKKYTKAIAKTNRPILPINVFATDSSQLFVLNNFSNDSTIKIGDEILSIDGHSTKQSLNTINAIYSSDGFNKTSKKQGIRYNWFKYYYSFCFGFKMEYVLKVKHHDRSITRHIIAGTSSLKDTLILPRKDSVSYLKKIKNCGYTILNDDKPIAVIDIDAFKGKHWRKFFRKTFKDIKEQKIEHLVIDLRDNGGGKIGAGLNFLSYFNKKMTYLSFDRKPNLMMFNPRYKMDVGSRITPLIFTALMPNWIKGGRLRHYFFSFPKKRKNFKGQVYVLVNGKSFSMSGVASTYLKYKSHAIVIGEETGGNIAGSNAVISGHITLPNSKVQVFIPMYYIYHNTRGINTGHGLMPDYQTHYTIDDLLLVRDLDMNKVKELVK